MPKTYKILLAGGGSGGPVAPLLALVEKVSEKYPGSKFLLVGTKRGPESAMAERAGVNFRAITTSKLRRYVTVKNLFLPFGLLIGFFQSYTLLRRFKPDVVVGAGSFVQVPVCYAAWILGIPIVIHQQDVERSLSNTLCSAIASKITVTFEQSRKEFSQGANLFVIKRKEKVFWIGNPVREAALVGTKSEAEKFFGLQKDLPTLLVLGGGTGALFINKLVSAMLPLLSGRVQIVHVTGAGKQLAKASVDYHPYEFLHQMNLAYKAADIVISRAGLSHISELAALGKVSILIPMAGTHQEANSAYMEQMGAAIVLGQDQAKAEIVTELVKKLLFDREAQNLLEQNINKIMPPNSSQHLAKIVLDLVY